MKALLRIIPAVIILFLLALSSCELEDNSPQDHCLILVKSSGTRYAVISPSTSKVLEEIEPGLPSGPIESISLGYNSHKVILTSKEPGGTYVKVFYSFDRETGDNMQMLTNASQWDIQSFSTSTAAAQIVFHGHPVTSGAQDSQLFSISENGTGLKPLTQTNEIIEGRQMAWAEVPSWSPTGHKIAFKGKMYIPPPDYAWWGNAILIMNADGSNKQILYNEPNTNSGNHKDISWTRNGNFLVFLTYEYNSTPQNRVKVLRIDDKSIIDITTHLMVDGKHTTNLCTSPRENKILFNKYQPGGGDLYEIDFEINESGQFEIRGPYRLKCRVVDGALQYGSPKWQLFTPVQP